MSGKIVRTKVDMEYDTASTWPLWPIIHTRVSGTFNKGDNVVVILESEYDALVEKAAKYDGLCK